MRSRRSRTLPLVALLALVGGPLAACADADEPEPARTPGAVEVEPGAGDSTDDPQKSPSPTEEAPATPTERGEVDLVSVVQAANDAERGAVVEVEWNDGSPAGWEVVVNQAGHGVELLLDPGDLSVLDRDRTTLDADERRSPRTPAAEAVQRAGAAVPGIVEAFSTGREKGVQVYEMRVRGEGDVLWEVLVRTRDGKVLRKERDD